MPPPRRSCFLYKEIRRMRGKTILFIATSVFLATQLLLGPAQEKIGPETGENPEFEQPDRPKGSGKLTGSGRRVYSLWVNGNENFYFQGNSEEINSLIADFSKIRMVQHELFLLPGKGSAGHKSRCSKTG